MERLLQKIGRNNIVACFVMVTAGIVCLLLSGNGLVTYMRGATQLPEGIHLVDYEGEYVSYTVKYPLEAYVEESSRGESGEVQEVDHLGYIVWDGNYDDYICVKVPASKKDEMEYLLERAWDYLTGESSEEVSGSLDVSGTIEHMTEEELGFYKETLEYMFGEGYAEGITEAYYIDDGRMDKEKVGYILFLSIATACCMLFGIGILLYGVRRNRAQAQT